MQIMHICQHTVVFLASTGQWNNRSDGRDDSTANIVSASIGKNPLSPRLRRPDSGERDGAFVYCRLSLLICSVGGKAAAAAASNIKESVPWTGRMPAAGTSPTCAAGSSTRAMVAALFAPPTRNSTSRAALRSGKVNVTRLTGGGSTPGGLLVTRSAVQESVGAWGKREVV